MIFDLNKDIQEENDLAHQASELVILADSLWNINHTTSFNERWQYELFD